MPKTKAQYSFHLSTKSQHPQLVPCGATSTHSQRRSGAALAAEAAGVRRADEGQHGRVGAAGRSAGASLLGR